MKQVELGWRVFSHTHTPLSPGISVQRISERSRGEREKVFFPFSLSFARTVLAAKLICLT